MAWGEESSQPLNHSWQTNVGCRQKACPFVPTRPGYADWILTSVLSYNKHTMGFLQYYTDPRSQGWRGDVMVQYMKYLLTIFHSLLTLVSSPCRQNILSSLLTSGLCCD